MARSFAFDAISLQTEHETPPRSSANSLPKLRSENRSYAERIQTLAAGRRSDSARDGCAPQDQRGACRLPGTWKTIAECGSDRALPEIHAQLREMRMNVRHAAALALVGWYLMTPPIQPGLSFRNTGRMHWLDCEEKVRHDCVGLLPGAGR